MYERIVLSDIYWNDWLTVCPRHRLFQFLEEFQLQELVFRDYPRPATQFTSRLRNSNWICNLSISSHPSLPSVPWLKTFGFALTIITVYERYTIWKTLYEFRSALHNLHHHFAALLFSCKTFQDIFNRYSNFPIMISGKNFSNFIPRYFKK